MKLDKETQEKLQELQLAEQNLQNCLLQRQAFESELSETKSTLDEVSHSSGDIYKITGQIMLKTDKEKVYKELKEKEQVFSLRLKAIENQEKIFLSKIERLRKDIDEKIKNSEKVNSQK